MKREIKFRGKRLDNGEWAYSEESFIRTEAGDALGLYNEERRVDRATVGQFIGLKDKHGRKVYEGDIMALGDRKNRIGVIVRSELSPEFVLRVGDTEYTLYYGAPSQRYEVLGNIYDHPNLLKH